MARVIAFTNQKGGVGKTTTCVNLSAYLVQMGKRVLVIDVDPQGNATSGVGNEKTGKTIYDVFCENCDISMAVQKTPIKNLDIIPTSVELAGAEVELVRMPNREKLLKKYLEVVRPSYDYICIDCPPSLGLLTLNAITAADALIIPIQCEYFALEGVALLVNTIKLIRKSGLNPSLDIDGVLLTMVDKRNSLTELVAAEILKYFGNKVFKARIPRNVRLAEAPAHGKPICLFDPKCAGAVAYENLAKEFLARCDTIVV